MKKVNYDNALTNLDIERDIELTTQKLKETVDRIIFIQENKNLNENNNFILEVSLWDKAKFYLSKLGRYKAGGKILGKGKIDQEAGAKIQKIIDKKGNEMIKQLHDGIQKSNTAGKGEFPNNQDPDIFLDIILNIATIYDNIVASTKLKPNEEGFLPIDVANNIIADLREYVKKYLDVDLKAVYSVMDSEEEKEGLIQEDEDLYQSNKEFYDLYKQGKMSKEDFFDFLKELPRNEKDDLLKYIESQKTVSEDDRSKVVRKRLQDKKGEDGEDIENERMKTLKSWRLPIALMGAGASFGALSWVIEYLFPAEKITTYTPEIVEKISEEKLGNIKAGEGMTQIMNRLLGSDLSPSSSPDKVVDALSKIGGGNPQTGVDIITQQGGIFRDPELAHNTLTELVNNPNAHGDTLKDVFQGNWAGTGREAGDTLVTVEGGTLTQMIVKAFVKWTAKTIVKKSAVVLFAGPILKTLGIGLLGAGVLVKLMREKGKRQSRAKTLNDLLQSLQFVKGEPVLDNTPVKGDEEPIKPVVDEPRPEKGKEEKGEDQVQIPSEFLQGNRNMQLAYLASNFLPEGQNLWNNLKLKEGTIIPSGFLDAALGQGKAEPQKYLKAFYNHLKKNDSFSQDINIGAWLATVQSKKNQGLIKWVRNTRKGIGSFISNLSKAFPEFEIGQRQKAKVSRPGEEGQAMGLAGESLNGRFDLLVEVDLGMTASQAGFDESTFMKNLPQFMEMISMMYYSSKGEKLPYNKDAVLKKCVKFGCKTGSSKKYKRTKSSDYKFVEGTQPIKEEINRIKNLMK